jgi:DNA-binding NarL/FixJ family response regulator
MSDHALTREALCLLIRSQPALHIVGSVRNGPSDLAAAGEKPDVILIDLDSSRHNGFDFLSEITKEARGARLIVLTGAPPSEVYHVIRLGVMGVVSKERPASFLLKAIEHVNVGEVWLDRSLMSLALRELLFPNNSEGTSQEAHVATLTKRQREVVALVGAGWKNEQIADYLSITVTTVRHHLTSIFGKLGVKGRFNLVFYAYEHGLAFAPRIALR